MNLIVGGVCCHNWTKEPTLPPKENDPVRHDEQWCEGEEKCPVSWVNLPDKGYSVWWTVCTF